MIVAFFADDASASHAALLTARGLATVERPTTLVQFVHRGSLVLHAPPCAPTITVERVDPCSDPLPGLQPLLDEADRNDHDVILSAPLHLMGSLLLSGSNCLPVLPFGATFMGTVAARRATAAPTTAMSGPTAGAATLFGRGMPQWLLACGCHNIADATSDAASRQSNDRQPGRIRLLPVAMPILRRPDATALLHGSPAPAVLRSAVLLAAVLEAAAADPFADGIDRTTLAGMLDPGSGSDDHRISEKLLALADTFDQLSDPHGRIPASASRRPDTLDRHRATSARSAPTQTAHASRPARHAAIRRDSSRTSPTPPSASHRLSLRRS
ncbi:hypothetical protein [Microvirga soli]|uniref:hypothetical protein n=1 Tax=Microvirga soli TaxID=1854496 RepID=UPI0019200273|nr:hypothetical protein [Microvirga soli]